MVEKVRENAYYHTRIKDWPEDERPREKLLKSGAGALSDAELLALIIGSGTGGVTAVDVAKRLIIEHEDLSGLASATEGELVRMKGVGPARGARILAAFELGRRVEAGGVGMRSRIQTPGEVFRMYGPILRGLRREIFKVLLLDSGNKLIRDATVSEGTLNASLVHPREVFKAAVDHLAAGIILVHNHPSGEPNPSAEDKKITSQLVRAGEVMGIPILDHVIIAPDRFFSFSEAKLLST
jgi:DNA repair protein RadC